MILQGYNLKIAEAILHECSFGRQPGLDGGYTADKIDSVAKHVKKNVQVVVTESEQDKSPHPAHGQRLSGTHMGDGKGESEARGIGGS